MRIFRKRRRVRKRPGLSMREWIRAIAIAGAVLVALEDYLVLGPTASSASTGEVADCLAQGIHLLLHAVERRHTGLELTKTRLHGLTNRTIAFLAALDTALVAWIEVQGLVQAFARRTPRHDAPDGTSVCPTLAQCSRREQRLSQASRPGSSFGGTTRARSRNGAPDKPCTFSK